MKWAPDKGGGPRRPAATRPKNSGAVCDGSTTVGTDKRAIAEIGVGERHRRDLGNIDDLAASIEDIGLLHAIVVDENGRLLAGARRLAACKLLRWTTIPVNVVRCET
jgi:hypothetical protein